MEEQKEEIINDRTFTQEEVQEIKSEMENKYLRLYAELENFKKRTIKEKEDLITQTKTSFLEPILDLENDMSIALKTSQDIGLKLIHGKFIKFLTDNNIEKIQTETYDEDLHEVISVLEVGESKIIDVVSNGYRINEKVIRYPKIILGR